MFSSFDGNERRRNIDLGGKKSSSSHGDVLHAAMSSRSEREDLRKKVESAAKVQGWWRACVRGREVRDGIRKAFDEMNTGKGAEGTMDVDGQELDLVLWTRYLVLFYRGGQEDDQRLTQWSDRILQGDGRALFEPFKTPNGPSWLVVLRQVLLLCLKAVARSPESTPGLLHVRVLSASVKVKSFQAASPNNGVQLCTDIISYLLKRGYYHHLASAFTQIPLDSKDASKALQDITPLCTAPFPILTPAYPIYTTALSQFTLCILSLPLLPNRLPFASLVQFSAGIPYQSFTHFTTASLSSLPTPDAAVHLLANILTFFNPRYSKLPLPVIRTLMSIYTFILDNLPIGSLEPPRQTKAPVEVWPAPADSDSDSDSDSRSHPRMANIQPQQPKPAALKLDTRTAARLATLVAPAHLASLLTLTSRDAAARFQLIHFLLSLITTWPTRKDKVLTAIIAASAGSLLKDLWRSHVRRSPLGKIEDADFRSLLNPKHENEWPPLLFFTELYTQTLLTMGDDEFFSSGNSGGTSAPKNPLTLDEVTAFSRQLLNIAFPLYWQEDQSEIKERNAPGVRMRWEGVRNLTTKCLQTIHARDSRRPFTPPDHWLVTSQIDVQSFIEAAVIEEQDISTSSQTASSSALPSHSRPLSKRQMAYLSPRLGVLNNIPFAIPFEVRVSIFRHFVENDRRTLGIDRYHRTGLERRRRVIVRRTNVAQDAFDHLSDLGPALKLPLEIAFIDQFGQEEAGIDGGGVFRELLTSLSKEVFDTNRGLWLETQQHELYPNPHSYAQEAHQLNWYRFIGRVLGKALYENVLIDVGFASFFLAKWLGKTSFLDDLASLDPELYQGLIFLKHYTGDPADLSLNFTVSHSDLGVVHTVNLITNGSEVPVTRENRLQYITLVSHYKLTRQIKRQSDAFFEGLSDIIDPKWLRMFNQQELKVVVGGVEGPVDLDDLRENVVYGGLYDESHPTIQLFWNVINSFNQEQRRALLRFVTSCSRPPLLGFKELVPKFAIRDAGSDENRLPTASTCVCLLKLPRYSNQMVMKQKLLQAINSGAGFDLS